MAMVRLVLILIVFFFLEGTMIYWLLPDSMVHRMVPNVVLAVVLYVGIYLGRYEAAILGFIFGLLQDVIYYGPAIGMHAFAMAFVGYVLGVICRHQKLSFAQALLLVALGSFVEEIIIYLIISMEPIIFSK
jgi:rod shape-determining protein MreD